MSALSFVALSLQTTHLDPATVSKASYVKLVDGNITRLDAIPVVPPTSQSDARPENLGGQTTWGDALSQLSMMIGKLPIVSYYRDADKEIFQAASRRAGVSLPPFQWLDCRALARELLPDLPEYQLSTVLKALKPYEDHADSSMVEQTAQIALELACRRGATTVLELWGDLYDQPDELLGLEATLEGLSSPDPISEASSGSVTSPSADAAVSAVPIAAVVPEPTQMSAPDTRQTEPQLADESSAQTRPGLENETSAQSEDGDETTPTSASAEDERTRPEDQSSLSDDAVAASGIGPDEEITQDEGGSTAQSVMHDESLEQPEFLKVPVRDEHPGEELEQDTIAETHTDETIVQSEKAEDRGAAIEAGADAPTLTQHGTGLSGNGVTVPHEPMAADLVSIDTDNSGDSTASSVLERENLEQPEFLKVPIEDESPENPDQEQDEITPPEGALVGDPVTRLRSPEPDVAEFAEPAFLNEPVVEEATPIDPSDRTDDAKAQNEEGTELGAPSGPNHNAAEQGVADYPAQAKPFQPVDQVVTPTTPPVSGVGSTRSVATTQYVEVRDLDRAQDEGYRKSSSRSGRIFGLLGMIVFGVLTVVGLVLTVLATLLFFTTNSLLLETKIAGVVLTGAIALLSLLMTTLSYRSFRRR